MIRSLLSSADGVMMLAWAARIDLLSHCDRRWRGFTRGSFRTMVFVFGVRVRGFRAVGGSFIMALGSEVGGL